VSHVILLQPWQVCYNSTITAGCLSVTPCVNDILLQLCEQCDVDMHCTYYTSWLGCDNPSATAAPSELRRC